jgi:hypothetical protein
MEEIQAAAEAANAHSFISRLPTVMIGHALRMKVPLSSFLRMGVAVLADAEWSAHGGCDWYSPRFTIACCAYIPADCRFVHECSGQGFATKLYEAATVLTYTAAGLRHALRRARRAA